MGPFINEAEVDVDLDVDGGDGVDDKGIPMLGLSSIFYNKIELQIAIDLIRTMKISSEFTVKIDIGLQINIDL